MNRRFLLTFLCKEGRYEYGWFKTEEEMKDFISCNTYIKEVQNCIEIKEAREVDY